jgi:2-polyprenyl-3-methyl-5-hydroxy-6-metoxy-1,4-benzoquinol methylase
VDKEAIVDYYDQKAKEWGKAFDARLEAIYRFLEKVLGQGKSVLDIGCGPGLLSRRCAETCAHVLGIDISPGMVERARQELGKAKGALSVHYEVRDIVESIEDLGEFDVVILADVLEHVLNVEQALEHATGAVKLGGSIVISWPHPDYRRAVGPEDQPVDHVIEIDWLKKALQSRGFEVVDEREHGSTFGDGKHRTYYMLMAQKRGGADG